MAFTWGQTGKLPYPPAEIVYRRVWPAMEAALHLGELIGDTQRKIPSSRGPGCDVRARKLLIVHHINWHAD